jgi:hypothetical protein
VDIDVIPLVVIIDNVMLVRIFIGLLFVALTFPSRKLIGLLGLFG